MTSLLSSNRNDSEIYIASNRDQLINSELWAKHGKNSELDSCSMVSRYDQGREKERKHQGHTNNENRGPCHLRRSSSFWAEVSYVQRSPFCRELGQVQILVKAPMFGVRNTWLIWMDPRKWFRTKRISPSQTSGRSFRNLNTSLCILPFTQLQSRGSAEPLKTFQGPRLRIFEIEASLKLLCMWPDAISIHLTPTMGCPSVGSTSSLTKVDIFKHISQHLEGHALSVVPIMQSQI